MTAFDNENGQDRTDLLQRIEMMEQMIAEGRQATMRSGWIFVVWGLAYSIAMAWVIFLPGLANWAWPVCVVAAIAATTFGKRRQKRAGGQENARSRSIAAVWTAMGCALWVYIGGAVASHHGMNHPSYLAAILIFIGLAHVTSALILRWVAQGAAGAVWWVGGFATFFATPEQGIAIFLAATFFGMIGFGLYAMMQERQRAKLNGSAVRHNA